MKTSGTLFLLAAAGPGLPDRFGRWREAWDCHAWLFLRHGGEADRPRPPERARFTSTRRAARAARAPIRRCFTHSSWPMSSMDTYGQADPDDCFLIVMACVRNMPLARRDKSILRLAAAQPFGLTAIPC